MTKKAILLVGLCACLLVFSTCLKADTIFSNLGPFVSAADPGSIPGDQYWSIASATDLRGSPAPQVQPTMKKAVERKSTEPSSCYAVQVGAYEDRVEATAMLNKLLMKAFPQRMTLTHVVTRDKPLWRLRVLAISRLEALKLSGRLLGEQGIKAWIVPIPCT